MKKVELYTDGACRGNPGPGGWGCILVYGKYRRELSGGEESTTNNRMELTAAIEGLAALKEPCEVTLTSDSRYLVDAVTLGWLDEWRKKNWRLKSRGTVKNPELWEKLALLLETHRVEFVWVKGHDGHPENERCDQLATAEADKYKPTPAPVPEETDAKKEDEST